MMNPDNPVKALYVEFLKGYYLTKEPFDLTLDQLLLMLANMVLQKRFSTYVAFKFAPEKGKYREMRVEIDELVKTIAERCAELQKRSGGKFG